MRATYRHPRHDEYTRPGGPWDRPSLHDLLSRAATTRGAARDLVVDGDVRLTGVDLEQRVAALATGLAARGAGRGDVVAWQAPNGHEAVCCYRACWRLGAIAAPIHHQAGADDTARMLAPLAPTVTLSAPSLPLCTTPHAITFGGSEWEGLLGHDPAPPAPGGGPDDLAAVLFTSGSAGTPKAVLHSQRTLAYKAAVMVDTHGLTADDVVLMPAPLAHISGLLNGVTLPGVVPFRSVLMARWDPDRALELVEREQVTFMIGPPTFFVSLMGARGFSPERVTSLRLVSSGGAGVSEAFVAEASERLGCVVKRTYGSTEAPTIATSRPGDASAAARRDGRAIGAVELRVVDPATGAARAAGEPGELWVQGPEVCCGYLDAEQTAAAFTPEGWFRTGDLATVDGDGWLTIVGRLKDVIIRGGENIAAAEIEAVLEAHPSVRQAVAVGYPDALMGERVCAFVVTAEPFDVEACRAWFAEQGVARYKTPERVVTVDELPLLPTGKPDRAALRNLAAVNLPRG